MDTVRKVFTTVQTEYKKNLTKKILMIDGLACYSVATGIIQVKNIYKLWYQFEISWLLLCTLFLLYS